MWRHTERISSEMGNWGNAYTNYHDKRHSANHKKLKRGEEESILLQISEVMWHLINLILEF